MNIKSFKSKAKLRNYVSFQIKYVYDIGDRIEDGEFFELLNDITLRHYDPDFIRGEGISCFVIAKCDINPRNKKLLIVRNNGTICGFSYVKAINGTKPKNEQYIKAAFRVVIQPQIDEYRNNFFAKNKKPKCEVTGLKIKNSNTHVDHKYPDTFDCLYYTFIRDSKIDPNTIKYNKNGVDDRPEITDKKIARSFYDWHKDNATLRCIYWRANLQQARNNKPKLYSDTIPPVSELLSPDRIYP
jgi:hypothetical protein